MATDDSSRPLAQGLPAGALSSQSSAVFLMHGGQNCQVLKESSVRSVTVRGSFSFRWLIGGRVNVVWQVFCMIPHVRIAKYVMQMPRLKNVY